MLKGNNRRLIFQVDVRFNKDRNLTYSVSYTPRVEGNHKVSVKFAGREIPKSPYNVSVEGHAGDPTKVTASGPGLNPEGNMVHRPTYFDISTKGILVVKIFIFISAHKKLIPRLNFHSSQMVFFSSKTNLFVLICRR